MMKFWMVHPNLKKILPHFLFSKKTRCFFLKNFLGIILGIRKNRIFLYQYSLSVSKQV